MKNTNAPTATCLLLPVALPALKQLMIIDACNSGKAAENLMEQVDIMLKYL